MGENMKRIILLSLLFILIAYICTSIKIEIKEKKYTLEENITIRVKRIEKNKIENISLEKYLVGVLAGEMPISYDIEALKAQAVAARTYAIKKMEQNKEREYDVVDTTSDQVYKDNEELKEKWKDKYPENIKKIKEAINQTSNEYLTYNGETIQAFFFSTSSGQTENCKDVFGENLPYLVSVASTWDETSPSYFGTQTLTKKEFYEKLELPYQEELNIETIRNETNSVKELNINGTIIKGTEFRRKLGLKSTNIEIEITDKIEIKSKGYGHGVGMSQYGAKELAQLGYKYDEILKYYYKDTEIKKIKKNV